MGEIADMMLDGTMCAGCGVFLNDGEDGDGIPGYCAGCAPDYKTQPAEAKASSPPINPVAQGAATAAVAAIEAFLTEHFKKQIRLSKGSKKRMRRKLALSVEQTLQNQMLI